MAKEVLGGEGRRGCGVKWDCMRYEDCIHSMSSFLLISLFYQVEGAREVWEVKWASGGEE